MATSKTTAKPRAKPELDTEVASRLRDPFETLYMGVIRSNDPMLLERGGGGQAYEIYRDLKRDGKVFSGLQKRKLALIGCPWEIAPVVQDDRGTRDAQTLTDIINGINFDQVCQDLLEALLIGFSVCEVVWWFHDGLIRPKRISKKANRRFVYVQKEENEAPALHMLSTGNMLDGEPLPDSKFIVHRVNPEDDNPYGTGLGLQLYWPVFFKRKGIVSWNKLCDRFGSPTPHGTYPKGAGPKEKRTLFDALKALSNDGVIMTPEGMNLTLLESRLTGSITTQQALCEYMDDWIAEVLLGTEPPRKGGGAAASASKEREQVRMDLVKADGDLLSETLNETLIKWLCFYNGLVPCMIKRVVEEEEDTKSESETDKNVYGLGFKPTVERIRKKYGEGWEPRTEPDPSPEGKPGNPAPAPGPANLLPTTGKTVDDDKKKPASFSEGDFATGQQAIDDAIAAVDDAELQAAMGGLFAPLVKAIEGAGNFEDALAAAEAAYPEMDTVKLQALLAKAMFGAETFARVQETD